MGIFKKKEETPVAAVAKTTDEAVLKTDKVVSPKTASILLRPVISEKATFANSLNQYVFAVNNKANKVEIKKAMINELGKNVRVGRRFGKRKNTKKAIVTLKKGDSITIYEGI